MISTATILGVLVAAFLLGIKFLVDLIGQHRPTRSTCRAIGSLRPARKCNSSRCLISLQFSNTWSRNAAVSSLNLTGLVKLSLLSKGAAPQRGAGCQRLHLLAFVPDRKRAGQSGGRHTRSAEAFAGSQSSSNAKEPPVPLRPSIEVGPVANQSVARPIRNNE